MNALQESSREAASLLHNSNQLSRDTGVLRREAGPSEDVLVNMSTKNRDLKLSIGGNVAMKRKSSIKR